MARIVCFGEILLRLASPASGVLLQDKLLEASFCGAEANVGVALAGFGHDCAMVSAVPEGALGDSVVTELRSFNLDARTVLKAAGRMGLYFLSPGAMTRPSNIIYDRQHSAFSRLNPNDYDWFTLLEGADWLFVSGITPALGDGPNATLDAAIMQAKAMGTKIALDSNFRPALWQGREQQGASRLLSLAEQSDLLFAGRRAISLMLGISFDQVDPNEGFEEAAKAMLAVAPRLQHIAATRRTVLTSDHHQLTALLSDRAELAVSRTIDLERIVDRVGTGDAYAAGILHGLASEMSLQDSVDFALGCSQWAHSVRGDFLRAQTADIEHLIAGSTDVRR